MHTMGIWGGEGCAHHGHLGRRGVCTSWSSREERGYIIGGHVRSHFLTHARELMLTSIGPGPYVHIMVI